MDREYAGPSTVSLSGGDDRPSAAAEMMEGPDKPKKEPLSIAPWVARRSKRGEAREDLLRGGGVGGYLFEQILQE